ncbi:MAG: hypothetical protein MZU97_13050 [Bacillus subtilis]|nr:hypothetical protein [Bacillus subtilis]
MNAAAEIRKLETRIDALHLSIETLKRSLFDLEVYGDAAKYREVSAKIAQSEVEADELFAKIAALQD